MHTHSSTVQIGSRSFSFVLNSELAYRAEYGPSYVDLWICKVSWVSPKSMLCEPLFTMEVGVPIGERDTNGHPVAPTVEYTFGMIAQALAFSEVVDVMQLPDHDLAFIRSCTAAMIEMSVQLDVTRDELIAAFLDASQTT